MAVGHAAFLRSVAGGLISIALLSVASYAGADSAPKAEPKKPAEPAKLDVGGAAEIKKADAPALTAPTPATPTPAAPGPTPATTTAPAAPAPAGTVLLKYKHEANQLSYYEVDHSVDITTQKGQSKQAAQNSSKTVKHYRVISVDEQGVALLELFIDRVKMSAKNDEGEEIAFDSDSKDDPPAQFENVRQAVGKPLARITVQPWGEIKSVIRLNGQADPNEGNDVDAGNNFLIILPTRPIRTGETWTDKADVKVLVGQGLNQTVTIMRNYELKGIKEGIATIGVTSTVLTPVRDPKIEGQLIQRTPSGTIEFDVEKGAIVSRTLKLDKTVIGVFADNSLMRVVSEKVEKLVPREKALRTADSGEGSKTN